MKKTLLFIFLLSSCFLFAQNEELPHYLTDKEKAMLEWYEWTTPDNFSKSIQEPPPSPVRGMAEWEELEALVVTWRSYRTIIREIVRAAKEEVKVIITYDPSHWSFSYNSQSAIESFLIDGGMNLDNIEFLSVPSTSVWSRDYLQNTVYADDVGDRYFIDWVYNRDRPEDDTLSYQIGEMLNTPVYSMTQSPTRLVNTGGNYMSDGMGTSFSSELVLEENDSNNVFGAGPHDEAAIDSIHKMFMGVDRYIKFETLPYDVIHHIDMHMHLLDEETIVFGEYPTGVADGPQIEANIQYLQDNHLSSFGTPYKIERIIQPPDFNGTYPNAGGSYRTYTNFVLVNNTMLLPFYEEQYDTIAQRFYEEFYPGVKVVGIDCNQMITALGALHCITKEVGVNDPLRIVHQRQADIEDNDLWGDYEQTAIIQHRSGIEGAQLFWTTDTSAGYLPIDMSLIDATTDTWSAEIPHQPDGTTVYYFIESKASSGKTQVRPLAAPAGFYKFNVDNFVNSDSEEDRIELKEIYPNPASAITVIPIETSQIVKMRVELIDVVGNIVDLLFEE
ncbi:MAG: agmatine deiminase family protein [Bacteroidota bacterium]